MIIIRDLIILNVGQTVNVDLVDASGIRKNANRRSKMEVRVGVVPIVNPITAATISAQRS